MSIIDQIDFSLDKASLLQQQRMQQEESRHKSLSYEVSQLREQIQDEPSEESDYSPERHEIQQSDRHEMNHEELEEMLLSDSAKKNSDEEDHIEPMYQKQPIKPTFKQTLKRPILKDEKKVNPNANTLKQKSKITQQKSVEPKRRVVQLVQIPEIFEQEQPHFIHDPNKIEHLRLKQQVEQVKQAVSNQLNQKQVTKQKENKEQTKEGYKIRGLRDQAEIKYFGRPLPCQECVYLLNKGMSSDFCSQHGKMVKERPTSQQVPKRFQKYL